HAAATARNCLRRLAAGGKQLTNRFLLAKPRDLVEGMGWVERRKKAGRPATGICLACGTEKNSVVAACCEVEVDRETGVPRVTSKPPRGLRNTHPSQPAPLGETTREQLT